MSKTIAIVEDEASIRQNYTEFLEKNGYRVEQYANRSKAQSAFDQHLPDLVLLDIGLEQEIDGGFELCRHLRSLSASLPIIFLTARDNDFDTVSGLRLGADDYLSKEVSLPHLLARVAALFRRTEAMLSLTEEKLIKCGPLKIDMNRLTVKWTEQLIDLTLTEFWIVYSLAKHPGHVKSRDQLMTEANIVVDNTTITSHVKRIRKKFIELDADFDDIETVYGLGYRWLERSRG
ncbi:MAG: proteobacterial dedicated sortase system response regulator [Methylococcales bacterium]|jgi:two-component system, OmpR family, response regulator|nr:proteobacterial dedicated sortase system response regulator [Methylococcales bacterium]MBT7443620.1 proteobacterial dedicated sortase system response regulator [Methylococcales bacterium]